MFGLLRKRSSTPVRARHGVPEGVRLYAIGDIHGCNEQLGSLLESVREDARRFDGDVRLVFVGDYVDRGPDSAGVLDCLTTADLPGKADFLMGNHEEAMLEVYDGETETLSGWLRFGGAQTLESYGISRAEIHRLGIDLPTRMREAVPAAHVEFLRNLKDQVRVGDYLFVHAGIRPGTPLERQDSFDLRWIREEFLSDEDSDHGAMVVHGHTISREPDVRSNRIGIDTGCYSSGKLTALVLEGEERRFLST